MDVVGLGVIGILLMTGVDFRDAIPGKSAIAKKYRHVTRLVNEPVVPNRHFIANIFPMT